MAISQKLSKVHVLIDYDGVVLRSQTLSKVVSKRCERFVRNVTGIHEASKLHNLNKALYTTYGHTVHGLRSLGFDVETIDFNKSVYGGLNLSNFYINDHDIDVWGLTAMLDEYPESYIYSNAPTRWIVDTMSHNPEAKRLLSRIKIIESTDGELLKPDIRSYCNIIDNCLSPSTDRDITFFVDDSLLNVQSAMRLPKLKGLWVTTGQFNLTDDITAIRGLDDALFQIRCKTAYNDVIYQMPSE